MKKISIVIPMHNSSKHIKQCLDSVVNQSYKNIEIIVVDDKSEDESVEVVKSIEDKRIRLIELQQNVGAGETRNKGIEMSNRRIYMLFRR